jgi:hypothetical protein
LKKHPLSLPFPIAPPRHALVARRIRAQDNAIEQQATDGGAGAS